MPTYMQNFGTAARGRGLARLRLAAVTLGTLALAGCADAFSPRTHDRDGTVVQLSARTRAELASPAPGTLELSFVQETGSERVQSFQGEIRFKPSWYRVLSATAGDGATASWHVVEPGRIRFAGVATEGITGRGISFRFEAGESFKAGDFELVIEEALLRSDLNAAAVRFAAPEAPAAGAAPVPGRSGSRTLAQADGAPATQASVDLRGDVNGDGRMDAVDALAVLAHVVGRELPASFAVQPQGDVSRDGAVTAADALLILEYRVGRDRVVDVRITSSVAPVDVADSLVLAVEVRGVRGELLNVPVQWSCPDTAWVRECGPRLYRPAIRSAPSPVPVRLVASSGGVADTLQATVFEQPLSRLWVDLRPYPASVSNDNSYSQQTYAIRAIPGGSTPVYAVASTAEGRVRPREFRVSVSDTTLFTAAVGKPGPERTQVVVTGRRAGSGILTVLTNGVSVPVRVEVAAPAALACSPGTSLSLDLAPGEIRTFRGSDPGAPGCLEFRAERDRGRQYLVLTHLLPYSTGRAPNSALAMFDFEGQALFYGAGEATPAEYPVFRFYTSDLRPASLAVTPRSTQAARRAEPGHTWRVGGSTLREGRPRRERAVRELRPGARRGGQGARLNVSGGTGSIQAGDTLVSGIFASLGSGVRTSDGAPTSNRAVVTHVGENLIVAEHLDVLRGRLIGGDGRTAARIPEGEYAKIDAAYGRPKRQLDRLFGAAYAGTVAGRDGGGRELAVNMPLQGGVWGYAYGDLTTINYWAAASFNGQPGVFQVPSTIAELLLAHEFTHVRHFQGWSDLDTSVGPWVVEGFADFGSQLAYAARAIGSETPSRTGLATVPPVSGMASLPSVNVTYGTLFRGYDGSSFVFAYLADQVEARGGDGLRAVRDLALSAHSRVAAEQAVQRHLPGHSLTDVIARAEVARYLEFLRKPSCGWCPGDPVPPALRIAPDLPAHTRYLQFNHPAMGNSSASFTDAWAILRPGRSAGTAYQLRTGTSWPIFIDGTDPLGDAQYLIDLSSERQTVFSVARIR